MWFTLVTSIQVDKNSQFVYFSSVYQEIKIYSLLNGSFLFSLELPFVGVKSIFCLSSLELLVVQWNSELYFLIWFTNLLLEWHE